jgi:hypothetical protein
MKRSISTVIGLAAMSLSWTIQAEEVVEGDINPSAAAPAPAATVSGRVMMIGSFGCGTYVAVDPSECFTGVSAINLPNCDDVPAGSLCESDGEGGVTGRARVNWVASGHVMASINCE